MFKNTKQKLYSQIQQIFLQASTNGISKIWVGLIKTKSFDDVRYVGSGSDFLVNTCLWYTMSFNSGVEECMISDYENDELTDWFCGDDYYALCEFKYQIC